MRNWKTTFAGAATLVALVAKMLNGGTLEMQDLATATAAIGLLVAKDHNVSGTGQP